jgi:hypothetical protein
MTVEEVDDCTGITTLTSTAYYYNCDTQIYSESTTITYDTNYCALVNIPSGYSSDGNDNEYAYSSEDDTYDDTTGEYTYTTVTYYYDCSTQSYWDETNVVVVEDYCASVNIPSGYTYDSDSGYYKSESSVSSEDDSTGLITTITTTILYDCST